MASMMTSGPSPAVRSRSRSATFSFLEWISSVAPARRAMASFESSRSMAMVRAPWNADAAIAPSPMPPQPMMATVSFAVTRPRATA